MLEGIDYYPYKKSKTNFNLWFLFLLAIIALYWFFSYKKSIKIPTTNTFIVIDEPAKNYPKKPKKTIKLPPKPIEKFEILDQVIHQNQNQNQNQNETNSPNN